MTTSKWATVTATGPLAIQVDGDTSALPFTPDSLTDPTVLVVGDRVWCEFAGRRVVVHGRAGGVLGSVPADIAALGADVTALQGRATALETRPQGVVPSSVVVGSGSASVADDGTVTFTGCSSVSLRDVFDGLGADIYDIYATMVGSVSAVIASRFRTSSADVTSGYNYVGVQTSHSSGPTRSSTFAASSAGFWCPIAAGASVSAGRMTVFGPMTSAVGPQLHLSSVSAESDRYLWDEYGQVAGVCPSFMVFPASGTITGQIKVVKVG